MFSALVRKVCFCQRQLVQQGFIITEPYPIYTLASSVRLLNLSSNKWDEAQSLPISGIRMEAILNECAC